MRTIILIFSLFILSGTGIAAEVPSNGLRDEIGQMLLIGFNGKQVNENSPIVKSIQKNNIGGVILFDIDYHSKKSDKNIQSPEQVKLLNQALQSYNKKGNVKYNRKPLPLLISVDYEGGRVNRLSDKYGFPTTQSAQQIGQKPLPEARTASQNMADTLRQSGFNLDFAPVLDVNVNPDNPVIGKLERSFSSDPDAVANYAGIYSNSFLSKHIQCAYKHFPGHGSSTKDSHLDFVDVSNTWNSYELEPYQRLINTDRGCGMVMTAHIVNRQLDESGLPATLSHKILTGLLREQMHFNGVIITDDMQMKAISDHYGLEQALTLSINAGADMLIFGNNLSIEPQDPKILIDIIEAKVQSGEIPRKRIDEAYKHISRLKRSLTS